MLFVRDQTFPTRRINYEIKDNWCNFHDHDIADNGRSNHPRSNRQNLVVILASSELPLSTPPCLLTWWIFSASVPLGQQTFEFHSPTDLVCGWVSGGFFSSMCSLCMNHLSCGKLLIGSPPLQEVRYHPSPHWPSESRSVGAFLLHLLPSFL
jgi:hypothetical protein